MFTGLIEECGRILERRTLGDGCSLRIGAELVMHDCRVDDSISVNGVCLTVVERDEHSFLVQAVEETLSKTTIGLLRENDEVNLERALLASDRMGGHVVQGHVDCVGSITSVRELSTSHEIWFRFADEFRGLVVETGSIALNGISLTVAAANGAEGMVAIIPHTWSKTTIRHLQAGSSVNIEFDIVGKYIASILAQRKDVK